MDNSLIKRQAAIDALDEQIGYCDKALASFSTSAEDIYAVKVEKASLNALKETLEYLPSAEPELSQVARDIATIIENEKDMRVISEPKTFTVIDTKTGREADTYNIALKEEWAKGLCYCDIDMFVIGEDGTLMLIDDCGKCAYCPQGRFEVKWNE